MKPLGIFLSSSRLPDECLKRVCDLTDRSSRCWSGWPARRSKSFLAREPSSRCSGLRGCGRGDLHCWKGLGLVRRRRHDCLHRDRDCESDLARFEILNSQQLKDSLLKLDSIFAAVRVQNFALRIVWGRLSQFWMRSWPIQFGAAAASTKTERVLQSASNDSSLVFDFFISLND